MSKTEFVQFERVIVNRDIPEENIKKGDEGILLNLLFSASDRTAGAVVERFDDEGRTIDVNYISLSDLTPKPYEDYEEIIHI